MKTYIRNLMVFIVSSLIITLVFSSALQGANPVFSISKDVHLTDKAVEKEVVIYNFFNTTAQFNLKLYTTPFNSEISENNFYLSPNESKIVTYKIYPIDNSQAAVYSSNLEVSANNNIFRESFIIDQAFNKKCNVSVDVLSKYIETNSYNIKLIFTNEENDIKTVILKNMSGAVDFNESNFEIAGNSNYEFETFINTEDSNVSFDYACNNVIKTKISDLEKKSSFLGITGYISLQGINNFIESIYFKILLVVLLVVLVLSFSTRYLRHVNKKEGNDVL